MHKGIHCIASEWSWQKVLSFFCFSFFQVHDLGRNRGSLLSWRWMCQCPCYSISPSFAESFWQGNHEETCPSQITCNGLLQISHFISLSLFLSHSFSLVWAYCWALSIFLSPSFPHFDLHKEHTNFPSVQAAFLHPFSNERGKVEWSTRKGSSLSIPAEYKDGHKLSSQCRPCKCAYYHKGWGQYLIWCMPYRLKVPSGLSVMEHKYWCVSWKQHQYCNTLQSDEILYKVCPAVGFLYRVGVAKSLHQGKTTTEYICKYIYTSVW